MKISDLWRWLTRPVAREALLVACTRERDELEERCRRYEEQLFPKLAIGVAYHAGVVDTAMKQRDTARKAVRFLRGKLTERTKQREEARRAVEDLVELLHWLGFDPDKAAFLPWLSASVTGERCREV